MLSQKVEGGENGLSRPILSNEGARREAPGMPIPCSSSREAVPAFFTQVYVFISVDRFPITTERRPASLLRPRALPRKSRRKCRTTGLLTSGQLRARCPPGAGVSVLGSSAFGKITTFSPSSRIFRNALRVVPALWLSCLCTVQLYQPQYGAKEERFEKLRLGEESEPSRDGRPDYQRIEVAAVIGD